MSKIFKYQIAPHGETAIQMPKGSKILSAGLDPLSMICIWVQANPEAPSVSCKILAVGTGWELGWDHRNLTGRQPEFVGSIRDGNFMWHVFDMGGC